MSSKTWIMSDFIIRGLWVVSLLAFIFLAAWSVMRLGNAFDQTSFGAGLGMVFAGGGIGVKLHSGTVPGV